MTSANASSANLLRSESDGGENNRDHRAEWARKTCAVRRKLVDGVAEENPEKP